MRGTSLTVMAWRNLWRNRRRTLLTLSSIVFGVFLAILFTAIQDRTWADTIDLAARLGGGHITIQHPEQLEKPTLSRTVRETGELIERVVEEQQVTRAVPRITGQTMLSTAGESFGAGFIAFDPRLEDESTLSIIDGLVEGEMFGSPQDRGIVLGDRLAQNLGVGMGKRVVYTMADVNGEIVSGLGRVSGIVRTGAPGMDAGLCLLPIDTVREVLSYGPHEATQIAVFIDDQRRADQVAGRLEDRLGALVAVLPWHIMQPELAGLIAIKVGGARFMEILIAILVAAGIFNTLFVSVMERLREFGIMMAIGFSPGKLFRLVMMESMWLAMVGLVTAAAVTAWPYHYLAETGIDYSAMMGSTDSVDLAGIALPPVAKVGIFPENLAIIAVAAVFATLMSGLYPAWKAGHVEPVESIKLV